jgi:hypothetical protein
MYNPPALSKQVNVGNEGIYGDKWQLLAEAILNVRVYTYSYVILLGDKNADIRDRDEGWGRKERVYKSEAKLSTPGLGFQGTQAEELLTEGDIETALPEEGLGVRKSECGTKWVDETGQSLLDTCFIGGLALLNGRFGPKSEHCSYLARKGQSVVDYIAVDVRIFSTVQGLEVCQPGRRPKGVEVSKKRLIAIEVETKIGGLGKRS